MEESRSGVGEGGGVLRRVGGQRVVFVKPNVSALNPRTLTQTFRWIADESDLPRIRLHDLRHTHASIAVKAGVPDRCGEREAWSYIA